METKIYRLKQLTVEVYETPICQLQYIKIYRVMGFTRGHFELINSYLYKVDAEKEKEDRMKNDPTNEYTDVIINTEAVFLRF